MRVKISLSEFSSKDSGSLRLAYRKKKTLFLQNLEFSPANRFKVEHGEDGDVAIRFKIQENEALSAGVVGGTAEKKEVTSS